MKCSKCNRPMPRATIKVFEAEEGGWCAIFDVDGGGYITHGRTEAEVRRLARNDRRSIRRAIKAAS